MLIESISLGAVLLALAPLTLVLPARSGARSHSFLVGERLPSSRVSREEEDR